MTLTGDTVQEIVDWLDQAGYAQDDDAPPILQEYLDDDFVFVAVKLRGGADVDAIHPLAIRYPGVEACIPIKLTRIAAVEDMAIRAFFLADQRTVPQNWPHVVINPAALDWITNPAATYAEVVSLAIDEAGGRAFITEYAGTDEIVSTSMVDSPSWDPAVFETIDPIDVVDALIDQGLGPVCEFEGFCAFPHPQVESLLTTYLPAPEGMDPYEFWGCLACYEGLIDVDAWSGPGFAADFAERISIPGEHAIAMLASSTYLTRLFTVISPHEMTEDPLFHENDTLGPVDSSIGATRTFACDGPDWIELDDGRRIVLTELGTYPQIAGMPIIERVERVPMTGPAQVEIDNTDLIDQLLADYDQAKLEGPVPFNCSLGRSGAEALLTMMGLFGIAWLTRRRRS